MYLSHVLRYVQFAGLLVASFAHGDIITVPAGLQPGDTYRLVFVTSVLRDATSADINDYNTFVNNTAVAIPALQALGVDWFAIASTPTVDAIDNVSQSDAPVYRLDGALVARSNTDLFDSFINVPIQITETGNVFTGNAWSGSRSNGTRTGDALGTEFLVRSGLTDATNRLWLTAGAYAPANVNALYAISSNIVVEGEVPEPSSIGFVVAGGLFFVACGARSRIRRRPYLSDARRSNIRAETL